MPPLRPHITVILATSLDGKLASHAEPDQRIGSPRDWHHLEHLVAQTDGILFGANTLRLGGTAMRVVDRALIQARRQRKLPDQPQQIVCSASGNIDPELPFFSQPVRRTLLTTPQGQASWKNKPGFEQIWAMTTPEGGIDWPGVLQKMADQGIHSLGVLGGGILVTSLFEQGLVDKFWLTLCPLILGGTTSAAAIAGSGFTLATAPRFTLLESRPQGNEVFLHYRVEPPQGESHPG
ncbi:RibD family protein [Candidatus Synechococcus calcipolaris G9]|uniref:RibD family protein n=1 Tax=Candidatus Synechococcus calcipolaris G9 TaxID=1497997 RepID=A0ABT6EWW4_9SYNE|nr:RibD family protein [Candidatus Synechococcus calcipolaris]MDG2990270.1 RibD family protein [Candidatus Synechococcus calcipolaris G9]